MSALDQALTKAYAKNVTAPASAATSSSQATAPLRHAQTAAPPATSSRTIERIYHDGTLYRVETPPTAKSVPSKIQPPHLKMLPPTSPRRSIRRSLQRLAATQPVTVAAEAHEPPPRIARKVIIRHISHPAAPPPLGLLRSASGPATASIFELPPEIFSDEPLPATAPSKPDTAPLNVAIETTSAIEIVGDWDHAAAIAPLTLFSSHDEAESPWAVVSVELDSLDQLTEVARHASATANSVTDEKPFTAKTLDDEEPQLRFRLDAAHSSSKSGPHIKFSVTKPEDSDVANDLTANSAPASATETDAYRTDLPALDVPEPDLTLPESSAPDLDHLTFAELPSEPLASDLIPQAETLETAAASAAAAAKEAKTTPLAAPLWEVDRFHWPRTCEKLFADEQGYLSQAGDKLQAAVQDGLRVLAITGTRRGEGRTTLSLCLARAAAQAGIQVAVMDADFARPQLASKIALEVAYGWQDAALGRIPLSEAAIKSLQDGVTALPLESALVTRGLSLADPRVTATIRAAAATFELLILDLGPIGPGEQLTFPPGEPSPLDAAIVVRDLRFATATESGSLCESLQDCGIEAVGIAENFVIEDELPATSV
jgi:Mrp family chromosome partitioning ATPase